MNVLIVHAHPEPQSFTAALRDQAVATFTAQGHQVQVSDLYAMNWNPVASAADFISRENPITWCMPWSSAWESKVSRLPPTSSRSSTSCCGRTLWC